MDTQTTNKPPNQVFKIITLNARGLNQKSKRNDIFQEIVNNSCDVLLIQEACCISQEVFNTWAMELQQKGLLAWVQDSSILDVLQFVSEIKWILKLNAHITAPMMLVML